MASNLTRTLLSGSRIAQTSFLRNLSSKGPGNNDNPSGGYGGSDPSSQATGAKERSSPSSQSSGNDFSKDKTQNMKDITKKATEWVKETKQSLSSDNDSKKDSDSDKKKKSHVS
ncbi:unnamed protein product [Adineta ricciae]|uniref:Uncharacterized protein n=1 Tax=Adineta ricciae TaxID=249248 RepID=A0A815D7V7_ADIRI|nr:unnamed protein product [Adineta ricciae]